MITFLGSYDPAIDFPLRGNADCGNDFLNSNIPNRMIIHGGMVGGPTIDETFTWFYRGSYVRSELTQVIIFKSKLLKVIKDYSALLAGAFAKLIIYYDQGPYCEPFDMGWSHPNASAANFTAVGVNTQQPWCVNPTDYTYTTGTTGKTINSNRFSQI
jgi:hypothetical protein